MNNAPNESIRVRICDAIRRQDGKLGWHEIAAEVGACAFAERGEIFNEIRALERLGIIRRQHGEGDARYWILWPSVLREGYCAASRVAQPPGHDVN